MKKLLSTLLSLMMLLVLLPTCVSAQEDTIDWSKYTAEEIALIQEQMHSNPEFDINDGEIVSISKKRLSVDEDTPKTRGAIGDAYMDLTVYVQRIAASSKYDTFKLQAVAEWKKTPAYQFEDALAIAWGDNFSQYSGSCSTYYKGKGLMTGMASRTDETADSGMAYTFPARYGPMHPLDKVIVTAYVRKADSTGETTAVAKYAHATVSLVAGISVGINGTNISFSAAGLLDTMENSLYFEY